MPEITLKKGQAIVHYQFNTAKGTETSLIYNQTKDFLLRGNKFTFVITVADGDTYEWVRARMGAIATSFRAQEDVLEKGCLKSLEEYSAAEHRLAALEDNWILDLNLGFRVLRTPPMPKEALEHPLLLCAPVKIKRAEVDELFLHVDGPPTRSTFTVENPIY